MATASPSINSNSKKKKKAFQNPEAKFHYNLNSCSKNKDLRGAITLYEDALSKSLQLNQIHFNTLLYLCSNSVAEPLLKNMALDYGCSVYDRMVSIGISPNEASITSAARLAAAKGDGIYAFELVKSMGKYNILPRLRTYDPALFCFCKNLDADKAYEVEEHMGKLGVTLEENELAALLKVSAEMGRDQKVYSYLHKIRTAVRCVAEQTGKIIEDWFCGDKASEVGDENVDIIKIKEATLLNGGGWHGLGWLGKGNWVVHRCNVDAGGRCCCCNEQLTCVDIKEEETEKFAQSIISLAMERETKANFSDFQGWLEKHDDYEAIVDGANVALYQQNFADGGFSLSQLDAVVKELYDRSGNKWPLVVLHNKRVRTLLDHPSDKKMVEDWIDKGVLYKTPSGSNDDWYWLYAAVRLKCLLVTNDEMRDHIFELLGSCFFNQWKERHQVHYTFVKGNPKLEMPEPYSLVIQESKNGSWHVPLVSQNNEGSSRAWLCIRRSSACVAHDNGLNDVKRFKNGSFCSKKSSSDLCQTEGNAESDVNHRVTGKRKEISP